MQTSLVRSCWSGLFTLGLAQCSEAMSLSTMLMAILNHLQSTVDSGELTPEPCQEKTYLHGLQKPAYTATEGC